MPSRFTRPAVGAAALVLSLAATSRAQIAPGTTRAMVERAAAMAPATIDGPVKPTWESVAANYKDPTWFRDAKFGIFMHWGLYSVPAYGSEWYVRHMYGNPGFQKWHAEHFGPVDKFGYKDFIPLFKAEKYDPDAWALLFKRAGAKYVVPSAEHHDGWANWDSDVTEFCAAKMGPKRDLIGDMAKAVRKQGLKFGVSNHRMNHYDFIQPMADVPPDLLDPKYDDFYWFANHSPERYEAFMANWAARSFELIDKYQLDMLWYDMGGGNRVQDPIKLKVAAYYFNRAKEWNKEVALSAKGEAFLAGTVIDYEREGRAPIYLADYVWQADDPIGDKFGYVEGMKLANAGSLVARLVENTSKNGNLLLNISPRGDGTIPQEQQDILLGIGKWLDVNGEAIYGTRPWTRFGEGPSADEAARITAARAATPANAPAQAGNGVVEQTFTPGAEGAPDAATRPARPATRPSGRGRPVNWGRANENQTGEGQITGGGLPRGGYKPADIRFTTKGDALYAIVMTWPGAEATVTSLAKGKAPAGTIEKVELLGHAGPLEFTQDDAGLKVNMPADKPCDFACALKITGLRPAEGKARP